MNYILPEESYYAIRRIASQIRLLSALAQHCKSGHVSIDIEALDDTLHILHHGLTDALNAAHAGRVLT